MDGKKLAQDERGEVATKGFIEDQGFATKGFIEDQGFVTKEFLAEQNYVTKEYLVEQNYVTKEYLVEQNYVNNTTFKEAIDVLVNLIERQEDNFRRYVESLHENHISLVSGMGEVYDFRIEKVEKRVDVLERRF